MTSNPTQPTLSTYPFTQSTYPQPLPPHSNLPPSHPLNPPYQSTPEQANLLLNTTRASFEATVIVAALSPRIVEIPERMKTALMQFLG